VSSLNKEDARKIVRKLGARIKPGGPHDIAEVWEGGVLLVRFGIRRGSRKDLGHGHISHQLPLRPHEAKDLALCPLSKDRYLELLAERGPKPPQD